MKFSVNNRLVLEEYVKSGLRSEVKNGIATPGQRDGLKGLKVLMRAVLSLPDGPREIPAGTIAYIKEVTLHTFEWASKPFTCATISGKFLLVDLQFVEFFDTDNAE
jgi:hypothetical protein